MKLEGYFPQPQGLWLRNPPLPIAPHRGIITLSRQVARYSAGLRKVGHEDCIVGHSGGAGSAVHFRWRCETGNTNRGNGATDPYAWPVLAIYRCSGSARRNRADPSKPASNQARVNPCGGGWIG